LSGADKDKYVSAAQLTASEHQGRLIEIVLPRRYPSRPISNQMIVKQNN
jgi:hypothetical protein